MTNLYPSEEIYLSLIGSYKLAIKMAIHTDNRQSNVLNSVYGPASLQQNTQPVYSEAYVLSNSIQSSIDKIVTRDFKNAYRYYWDHSEVMFPLVQWKKYKTFSSEELLTVLEVAKTEHLPQLLYDTFIYDKYDGTKHLTHILFKESILSPILLKHHVSFNDFIHIALEQLFSAMKDTSTACSIDEMLIKKPYEKSFFLNTNIPDSTAIERLSYLSKWLDVFSFNLDNKEIFNKFWQNQLTNDNKHLLFTIENINMLNKQIENYMKTDHKDVLINSYVDFCLEKFESQFSKHNLYDKETIQKIKKDWNSFQHRLLDNSLDKKPAGIKFKI